MSDKKIIHEEMISLDGKSDNFRLRVTERSDYTVEGTLDEVTGWSGDKHRGATHFEEYLEFSMKWDGCCHVWFGEEIDGERDGYIHLCGSNAWVQHCLIMRWLYQWAEKYIPMTPATSGDSNFKTEWDLMFKEAQPTP